MQGQQQAVLYVTVQSFSNAMLGQKQAHQQVHQHQQLHLGATSRSGPIMVDAYCRGCCSCPEGRVCQQRSASCHTSCKAPHALSAACMLSAAGGNAQQLAQYLQDTIRKVGHAAASLGPL
jgi:hypothetical protein